MKHVIDRGRAKTYIASSHEIKNAIRGFVWAEVTGETRSQVWSQVVRKVRYLMLDKIRSITKSEIEFGL